MDQLQKDTTPLKRALSPAEAKAAFVQEISCEEADFRFAMNQDAMATEKLAEGIRIFAADIQNLENIFAKRIEA
jgi:transaldolase